MTITVEAIYEDGVLRPMQPLTLPEHERVRVTVELRESLGPSPPGTEQSTPPRPSLAERIATRGNALPAGALDQLPDDLAAEHDHYLYGTKKRSE